MSELDARSSQFSSPMERLLYLRSTAYLTDLRGDALSTMAQQTRETFVRAGTRIFSADTPQKHIYFLVEGQVDVHVDDLLVQRIEAPGGLGFLPLLGQAARRANFDAVSGCVMLELDADDMLELLEEDYFFLDSVIRALAGNIADAQAKLETAGLLQRTEPEMGEYPKAELDFVGRLKRLRVGPYAQSTMEALADLARRAQEVRYAAGDVIWREGELDQWGLHIVHGIVECRTESPARSFKMGANSSVGALQAQAQRPRAYTCVAETAVVGLRTESDSVNDIIEDHPDLGLMFLSFLSDMLFGLQIRLAKEGL